MKKIYENEVKGIGSCVDEFKEGNMFILFGDNAPEELRDYCYSVSVNPINGEIKAGQILRVDEKEYKITAVGPEAPVTLAGLGHCTINLSGSTTVELPGTIYVENNGMPEITVGTKVQIVER
ncbi:MAG: PTS glucitol/sorbitol transporter subunit IIA [Lachnospiraceae bacterium]|nr:PTS glucitol/sorbitol transporter subunit IIA [Lachnospiraceae bacterium]